MTVWFWVVIPAQAGIQEPVARMQSVACGCPIKAFGHDSVVWVVIPAHAGIQEPVARCGLVVSGCPIETFGHDSGFGCHTRAGGYPGACCTDAVLWHVAAR